MTDGRTCPNGHAVFEGDAYCTVCGARAGSGDAPALRHGQDRYGRGKWIVLGSVVLLLAVAGVGAWVARSTDEDEVRPVPTTAEFCDGYMEFGSRITLIPPASDEYAEELKDAASDFEDVGTPNAMPADAKAGLQISLDAIQDLDDDATQKEMAAIPNQLDIPDRNQLEAFNSYVKETCLGVLER